MDVLAWIIISVVIIAVILGLLMAFLIFWRRRGEEMRGKDYKYFLYVGLAYLMIGIVLSFLFPQDVDYINGFTFFGIIFTAMGLANIEKWRKHRL